MTRTVICAAQNGLPELFWQPSPNFNAGAMRGPNVIVVHDTEGGFEGAIATFANSHAEVSAHFVLKEDGTQAVQMVKLADKAWHVCIFNGYMLGIEMSGFAARGFGTPEWRGASRMVAYLLHRFNLPAQWAQHGQGKGFCRHYDLGQLGGGHTDPCAGSAADLAIWQTFVGEVQSEAAKGGWPDKPWGL